VRLIVELCVAGVVAPGGSWWDEDAAVIATAVDVLQRQAEAVKRKAR
jgi:hypothetical protein